MNEIDAELQRQMHEHSAKSLKLFDKAKRLQRESFDLPSSARPPATREVIALEREAIVEAKKATGFEIVLAANQRREMQRQITELLNKKFFRVKN